MNKLVAGLVAGLFAGFAYAVMPGLRRADDATVVQAMREVNRAILNPVFAVLALPPAQGLPLAGQHMLGVLLFALESLQPTEQRGA